MADITSIPTALSPDAVPVPPPEFGLGQQSDLRDAALKAQDPANAGNYANPAQDTFNRVKSEIDMQQPGLAPEVREKLALEQTQKFLSSEESRKAERELKASQPTASQQITGGNEALKQQLGLSPTPAQPQGSTSSGAIDPSGFAAPPPVQSGSSAVPEMSAVNDMEKAFQMQERGIAAAADAGAHKVREQAGAAAELQKQIAIAQERADDDKRAMQTAVDSHVAQLGDLEKTINSESTKINPERYWDNKGTGQKIVAGIAIALGGLGGALTGKGDNKAMDVINKSIDQDIQAQKDTIQANAQKRGQQLQVKSGMLSALNQQFGNEMQAESAARYLMLQKAENQAKIMAAPYESDEIKAKGQILLGQIQAQKATELQKFKTSSAQTQMLSNLSQQGGGLQSLSPAQRAALPKAVQDQLTESDEKTVPGWGQAANKNLAQKFSEYVSEAEPALVNAKEILELNKSRGSFAKLSPTERAAIETRSKILAGQLRLPITGPGALTADEYARLRETIGNPNAIMAIPAAEMKKLNTVINWLQENIQTKAKQAGLPMKKELLTLDTSGTQPRNK